MATLKANAQLVVVDVVVTDKRGKPVHGMQAADFSLKEDNAPQVIKNFEEHSALTLADATKFPAMQKQPPGIFTDFMPAAANGAVNLVLLDSLNTPMGAQAYVRQQLVAYLKSTPPGSRTAIFGLTTRLLVLQGFTSDPEVLKSLLSKGFGKGSSLLNKQPGGGGVGNTVADEFEDAETNADVVSNLRQFDAQQQAFSLQLRAEYTLDAMRQIARYLAIIPGRKNLIWFSGSFPINLLTDTTSASMYDASTSSGFEFRETLDLLARSRVAVYPIDALSTSPVFEAANGRNYGSWTGMARLTQEEDKYLSDTAGEHAAMQAMALATGGNAFVNSSGLTASVSKAIDEGSNFYTLAYTPTNSERDGKFRKIKVQLARQDVTLSYRQGYYADDPGRIKSPLKFADAGGHHGHES